MRKFTESLRSSIRTTAKVVAAILVVDIVGISVFQLLSGELNLSSLVYALPLVLMLEGAIIGVVGSLLFLGYSEYRMMGQAAINPQIARESVGQWDKRRMSQKDFGVILMIVGFTLLIIGLSLGALLGI